MMHSQPEADSRRPGMTLLEVILAMSIFLSSLVALSRLFNLATDNAMSIQGHSRAARLAESKLAEYVSGVYSVDNGGSSGTFDTEPDWQYTVTAQPDGTAQNLYAVSVTVTKGNISTTLTQYVFDPNMRGSIQPPQTQSSSSSSGSSSSSSSNQASNSSSAAGSSSGAGGGGGGAAGGGGGGGAGGGGAMTKSGGTGSPGAMGGASGAAGGGAGGPSPGTGTGATGGKGTGGTGATGSGAAGTGSSSKAGGS